MKIEFLGAINCVGGSGIIIEGEKSRILLDYGAYPKNMKDKKPIEVNKNINYFFLSHGHLDHVGFSPLITKKFNCNVYSTDITIEFAELLLEDSIKISEETNQYLPFDRKDIENLKERFIPLKYNEEYFFDEFKIKLIDASHIPGSSHTLIEVNNKKILYTGDFNTIDTQLLKGNFLEIEGLNYLITESTYHNREHPDRKEEEKRLVKIIDETIENNGVCLIPSFAISRAQEVLMILSKYKVQAEIYMDGMSKKATIIISKYKKYLRNEKEFEKSLEKVKFVRKKERKKIIKRPCVIISGSGFLDGGPALFYFEKLMKSEKNSIIFVGYQVENSIGRMVLEKKKYREKEVKSRVEKVDLSAHVGSSDLFEFIEKNNPEKIFCVHGENLEEFVGKLREKGFDATAPTEENRVFEL